MIHVQHHRIYLAQIITNSIIIQINFECGHQRFDINVLGYFWKSYKQSGFIWVLYASDVIPIWLHLLRFSFDFTTLATIHGEVKRVVLDWMCYITPTASALWICCISFVIDRYHFVSLCLCDSNLPSFL